MRRENPESAERWRDTLILILEFLLVPTASFASLGVPTSLTSVLAARGITSPTPIQAATLADSMSGRDVLGRGRTGSGKTYAFLLPVVTRLMSSPGRRAARRPRALILAPTRELAGQIEESLRPLANPAGLRSATVFGGVSRAAQVRALAAGVDVLIACPGRLEDLMSTKDVLLDAVEITVLDEADHMADLGFLPGVKRIMDRTPRQGQRMLFSATLDSGVDTIVKRYLNAPVTHSADSETSPVSTMEHHVLHVSGTDRLDVLIDLAGAPGRSLVFTRTKHGAKKLTRQLNARGVGSVELHGNLTQPARTRNLEAFHSGQAGTLVATDIAARGIHVDNVGLVIHADPPVEHKAYLHRSGRTARAGAQGRVITLMTDDQVADVRTLTRKAGVRPTTTRVGPGHPVLSTIAPRPVGHVPTPAPASVLPAASSPSGAATASSGRSSSGRSGSARANSSRSRSGRPPSARSGRAKQYGGRRSRSEGHTHRS